MTNLNVTNHSLISSSNYFWNLVLFLFEIVFELFSVFAFGSIRLVQ